jgi:hypothetical protein
MTSKPLERLVKNVNDRQILQSHWSLIREAQRRNKGYAHFDASGFDSMGVAIATFQVQP